MKSKAEAVHLSGRAGRTGESTHRSRGAQGMATGRGPA